MVSYWRPLVYLVVFGGIIPAIVGWCVFTYVLK